MAWPPRVGDQQVRRPRVLTIRVRAGCRSEVGLRGVTPFRYHGRELGRLDGEWNHAGPRQTEAARQAREVNVPRAGLSKRRTTGRIDLRVGRTRRSIDHLHSVAGCVAATYGRDWGLWGVP